MASEVPHELLTTELHAVGDSAAILRLKGEVDISSAPKLAAQFQLAAESGCSGLLIDATEVTFMDSSGLHALVEASVSSIRTAARSPWCPPTKFAG